MAPQTYILDAHHRNPHHAHSLGEHLLTQPWELHVKMVGVNPGETYKVDPGTAPVAFLAADQSITATTTPGGEEDLVFLAPNGFTAEGTHLLKIFKVGAPDELVATVEVRAVKSPSTPTFGSVLVGMIGLPLQDHRTLTSWLMLLVVVALVLTLLAPCVYGVGWGGANWVYNAINPPPAAAAKAAEPAVDNRGSRSREPRDPEKR